jgi:hypothetical protein
MALKNTVKALNLKAVDASLFADEFLAINPDGTEAACFLVRIINNSTEPALISYDGVNIHDFVDLGDTIQLSFQANHGATNQTANLPLGTVVYAKNFDTVGTGSIILAGYYQPN